MFDEGDSPYLNKMFKPTFESLSLADELEPLAPLLMSQHEALTISIKNLISTNLTLTKRKKKVPYPLRLTKKYQEVFASNAN
jgi:hypothetical protein